MGAYPPITWSFDKRALNLALTRGVFRQKDTEQASVSRVAVNSVRAHNYHPVNAPSERSLPHAVKQGYDLSDL